MARNNYDCDTISLREYKNTLRTSIEDLNEAVKNLRLLEKLLHKQRISGRSIKAIRMCACFTLANVNLHLLPAGIDLYEEKRNKDY